MLVCIWYFGRDVLNQAPSPVDVPDLHPKTDGQKRQTPLFRFLQNKQVGLVLEWVYGPEHLVRLAPIAQRVCVRSTARQKQAVQPPYKLTDQLCVRDKWDVYGDAARGGHRLAVLTREVETLRLQLVAHRDADQRSGSATAPLSPPWRHHNPILVACPFARTQAPILTRVYGQRLSLDFTSRHFL